jgi:hypothetical protein
MVRWIWRIIRLFWTSGELVEQKQLQVPVEEWWRDVGGEG